MVTSDLLACPAALAAGLLRRASAPSLGTAVSSRRSLKLSLNASTPVFWDFLGAAVCSTAAGLGLSGAGFSWATACFFSSFFSAAFSPFFSSVLASFFSSFFSSFGFAGSGFLCSFLTIIASRSGTSTRTGRTGGGRATMRTTMVRSKLRSIAVDMARR